MITRCQYKREGCCLEDLFALQEMIRPSFFVFAAAGLVRSSAAFGVGIRTPLQHSVASVSPLLCASASSNAESSLSATMIKGPELPQQETTTKRLFLVRQ